MPEGPVSITDWGVTMPEKDAVYTNMEGMIAHFKLIMDGIKVPAGEVYSYTETPNGELGYYLVSDGSGKPYRVRVRPPCFYVVAGVSRVIDGYMIADIIPTFDSMMMVGGELDR